METNAAEKLCAKCMKFERIAMCCGCQQSFCTKDFIRHRLFLSEQMDNLHEKYEAFREDLNRDHFEQSLLSSIYAWERKSIRKIQEIAEKARNDLQKWMDKTKTNVKNSLEQILLKFKLNEKTDDYTELDLEKWTKQLEELRNLIEKSTNISLIYDKKSSFIIREIKIIEQSSSTIPISSTNDDSIEKLIEYPQEYFVKIFGPCQLSEDNRIVTHSSYRAGLSQINGKNSYSSGKHSIEFLIENKGNKNIFLGIISSLKQISSSTFDYSIHGWWNFDHIIINGESELGDSHEMIQTGDKLRLIIDCDNQQLQLEHYRTKRMVNLSIKLDVCPFPWKIMVRLLTTGDCVRIL